MLAEPARIRTAALRVNSFGNGTRRPVPPERMYDRHSQGKLLTECSFIVAKAHAADQSNIREFDQYLLNIELVG